MIEDRAVMLNRNLSALGRRNAAAAGAIRAAVPACGVVLETAPDGGLTGTVEVDGLARRLASARGPIAEGERLAAGVDIVAKAAVVVMGFGAGHHVAALARRVKTHGVIVVFEPDVGLLRAVFERADCSTWLTMSPVVLVTSSDDAGALAASVQGMEAVLASGVAMLDHPPSTARLGETRPRFAATFAQVMKAVRTNVVTTLVQMDVTVRNLLQNAAAYAGSPGVAALAGVDAGRAAVVVSAGPSLRRNVDLLRDSTVRERVVVIAVQTVLKPLLAKGIRPDYVTALDYHEISARFYEGLTREAVEGVTLVVEPKCNPAILAAWPGAVRCVGDETLDAILGPGLATPKGRLPPGATVAHLAYYLARHLGCDPVILIGQDLGFTDGQYYGPGAAIHNVWAGELNEFNTLEMLEWQRIARMRNLLRPAEDVHGRRIYTDEQMSTYLVQFERDFGRDAARGLRTIDATEGGVRKRHTEAMTLREALSGASCRGAKGATSISRGMLPSRTVSPAEDVRHRLQELGLGARRVATLSREAGDVLREMKHASMDQRRVNELIERVNEIGRRAAGDPAYWLVQHVNQTGQLNRYKADRAIEAEGVSGLERQAREIERDVRNVEWLADAADLTGRMMDDALAALTTGRPVTRDAIPEVKARRETRRAWAVVCVDHERGGLGVARDLARPIAGGQNALQLMLARLARSERLGGVALLCRDVEATRAIAGTLPAGLRVEFAWWNADDRARRKVAAGRAWARHCWRGGVANLSAYDEVFDAAACAGAMAQFEIDAAVVLGPDWCLVDPAVVDTVIERHEERPEGHPMTFTQAPPGLAPCLLSRGLVEEFARVGGVLASPGATVGGLLGYQVVAPQGDPIAKPACVAVPPGVRDCLVRFIPDTPVHAARLAMLAEALGAGVVSAGAEEVARAAMAAGLRREGPVEALTLRVSRVSSRGATGLRLREAMAAGDAPAVTIEGDGCDVLDVPQATELAAMARAYGASAVHVRTRLARAGAATRRVLALADVVSVDLLAEDATGYGMVTGDDGYETARAALETLIVSTRAASGDEVTVNPPPGPFPRRGGVRWVVPRMTRRDEVLEQVEPFYTRWLLACGACVIDARPDSPAGARIEALPLPEAARERLGWSRRVLVASEDDGEPLPLGDALVGVGDA